LAFALHTFFDLININHCTVRLDLKIIVKLFSFIVGKAKQHLSFFVWKQNTHIIEFFGRFSNFGEGDPEYRKVGFKFGTLPNADLVALQNLIKTLPPQQFQESDHLPWHAYTGFSAESLSDYSTWLRFYDLTSKSEALYRILKGLVQTISSFLGHGVKIVNMRCWGMLPNATEFGPNVWHSDCFPSGFHKVLISLVPAGHMTGTTEMRLDDGEVISLEGPPGSWVFFNSTKLFHRGIPPKAEARIVLELTIAPAFNENYSPVFSGNNAGYPLYPWI
jgi:hypothetical protein